MLVATKWWNLFAHTEVIAVLSWSGLSQPDEEHLFFRSNVYRTAVYNTACSAGGLTAEKSAYIFN